MKKIQIIQVNLNHLDQLQKIAKETFLETFLDTNSPEDMQDYLDTKFSVSQLTSELKETDSFFYFAFINHQLCGYLKINLGQAQQELQEIQGMEIERIYVLQEYHHQGIGQALYQYAYETAKKKQLTYIWLGVWEHNVKAIQFYKKNGFIAFSQHIFQLGDDQQIDIMMKKTI